MARSPLKTSYFCTRAPNPILCYIYHRVIDRMYSNSSGQIFHFCPCCKLKRALFNDCLNRFETGHCLVRSSVEINIVTEIELGGGEECYTKSYCLFVITIACD